MGIIEIAKKNKTTNWFFWIIMSMIGLYYAFHFFVASHAKEVQMNEISTNELVSMVESIKGRELFYSNLVNSWSNNPDICSYFEGVFKGKFKCKLDNPNSQDVFDTTFTISNSYLKDSLMNLYNIKKTYQDKGEYFLPFIGYHIDRDESTKYNTVYDVNRLFLPLSELFKGLINKNSVIEGYTINSKTIDEGVDSKFDSEYPHYNSSPFSEIVFHETESLFNQDTTGYLVQKASVTIGGNNFEVLSTKFKLAEYPIEFQVVGYVSEARWLSEVREFDLHGSLLFGGMVLIIILLIPHLRIVNLSKSDRLGYVHVVRLFTTIMLIVPILLLMFRFNQEYHELKGYAQNYLENNHDTWLKKYQARFNELSSITEVPTFGNALSDKSKRESHLSKAQYKEFFHLSLNGEMKELGVFNGKIPSKELKDTLERNINFGYRAYVQQANKKDTKFELVKSVSSNSGIEIIFSERKGETIRVITSDEPEIDDAEGSFYHIITHKGEILYDSRNKTSVNVLGDLFDRVEGRILDDSTQLNKFVKGESFEAIYQNERRLLEISPLIFNGKVFGRTVSPVEKYYLISFQDLKGLDTFHGATFGVVLLLMLGYFFVVFLLWYLIKFISTKKTKLDRSLFSMPWLLPRDDNRRSYYIMSVLTAAFILLQLVLEPYLSFKNALIISASFSFLLGLAGFFFLSGNTWFEEEGGKTLLSIKEKIDGMSKSPAPQNIKGKEKLKRAYGVFLVLWLLAFSVVPTWVFLEKVQEVETSIQLGKVDHENVDYGRFLISVEDKKQGNKYEKAHASLKEMGRGASGLMEPGSLYINMRKRLLSFPSIQETQFEAMGEFKKEPHYTSMLKLSFGPTTLQLILLGLFVGLLIYFYQKFVFSRIFFEMDFKLLNNKFDEPKANIWSKNERLNTFLDEELKPLGQLDEPEIKDIENLCSTIGQQWTSEVEEYMVISLQEIFRTRYNRNWDDCTPKQKLILYDLSEDGCLNATNKRKIIELIQKRLICYNAFSIQGPETMNKSFQNHVMAVSDEDENLQEQLRISAQGKWSNAKTFVLIAALLMFFLSFTVHEKVLEQAFAIATGAIAVIPSLAGSFSNIQVPKFRIG